jgi:hypothetical protein
MNRLQNTAYRARADRRDDPIRNRLSGQVRTRPVRDRHTFGDGFQTGPFNNLGTLEGGKSPKGVPYDESRRADLLTPVVDTKHRSVESSGVYTASVPRAFEPVDRWQCQAPSVRDALDTKGVSDCRRSAVKPPHHRH